MSTIIEVAGLSKHHGSTHVVRDMSFALDENRIHGLLGRDLEHLGGSALDFRNLTTSIARKLLETGGFRSLLHSRA